MESLFFISGLYSSTSIYNKLILPSILASFAHNLTPPDIINKTHYSTVTVSTVVVQCCECDCSCSRILLSCLELHASRHTYLTIQSSVVSFGGTVEPWPGPCTFCSWFSVSPSAQPPVPQSLNRPVISATVHISTLTHCHHQCIMLSFSLSLVAWAPQTCSQCWDLIPKSKTWGKYSSLQCFTRKNCLQIITRPSSLRHLLQWSND